jgi:hypothetical protein
MALRDPRCTFPPNIPEWKSFASVLGRANGFMLGMSISIVSMQKTGLPVQWAI